MAIRLIPETRTRSAIRSFVVRAGRMTAGQQRAIDALWPTRGCSVHAGPFVQADPQRPLILDIGFGMGHALAAMAQQHPENDYLGVEVYPPGVGSLLVQVQALQLTNVRVYCADVMLVLAHCLANNSVDGVQIFFPDPWHKKRHHKRRLINAAFLDVLANTLKHAGFLHIATDWQPYAAYCQQLLTESACYHLQDHTEQPITRPTSKFEQRGLRLGHDVFDMMARVQHGQGESSA